MYHEKLSVLLNLYHLDTLKMITLQISWYKMVPNGRFTLLRGAFHCTCCCYFNSARPGQKQLREVISIAQLPLLHKASSPLNYLAHSRELALLLKILIELQASFFQLYAVYLVEFLPPFSLELG